MVKNIDRRGFLKKAVGTAGGLALAASGLNCGGPQRVNMSGSPLADSSQKNKDPVYVHEDNLRKDILNFGKALKYNGEGHSVLADHANKAREAYTNEVWKSEDEKKRLEWVVQRSTGLVAWSTVRELDRDIASAPGSVQLDDLVRLHIAEELTINKAGKRFLKKRREAYESAYEEAKVVKIDKDMYNTPGEIADIKERLLNEYILKDAYKAAIKKDDPLHGLFKVAGKLFDHMNPFKEFGYVFKHSNMPEKPGATTVTKTGEQRKKELDLFERLFGKFEGNMFDYFRNHEGLGGVEEVVEKDKKKYRIHVDSSGVAKWISEYNNAIAHGDLKEAQYVNKAVGLEMRIKSREYHKSVRGGKPYLDDKELRELWQTVYSLKQTKGRVQTALAWKEAKIAEADYQRYEKIPTGDEELANTYLARAMARSLAAYVLATDKTDQEMFYNLWQHYADKVKEREVKETGEGRAILREAYIKTLYPYMNELKSLDRKIFDAFVVGSFKTATITLNAVALSAGGGAGGAGGAVGGGGLSVTGGFI